MNYKSGQSLSLLFFFLITSILSGQQGIIRGTVYEQESALEIIGGNIYLPDIALGTATDIDGSFELSVDPGTYTMEVSYIGFQTIMIEDIEVKSGEVTLLDNILLPTEDIALAAVTVTAEALRNTESAMVALKRKSTALIDGISASKIRLTGDATAVEAAKRITGVSIEGGKYVFVRGLSDRYTSTLLNNVDIPGIDPDRNSIQMDIFPSNILDNIIVRKNFTPELPANFTGGLVNIETAAFPDEKIFEVSLSTSFNPQMNLNNQYLSYNGGKTDYLGFDDGTRALPEGANQSVIPTPTSGAGDQEVSDFVNSFNPELGARRSTSPLNFSASLSLGNQFNLGNSQDGGRLGYIFSLSYKNEFRYYDDVKYGEYQRYIHPDSMEMRYATRQNGQLGENTVLVGALGGLAYKNKNTKIRLNVMHLQSGESRAGQFTIDNDGEAVGQSGYLATSDNLEYNQRSLTNALLNGTHVINDSGWEIDWRLSPTLSNLQDPDIRKTAFTITPIDTLFIAGAGGNPSRIWRDLEELNAVGKVDVTKRYMLFNQPANLKFGFSQIYKERDYEILFFDMQFFGTQNWENPDAATILNPDNIYPNRPNRLYYASGNNDPNPNAYNSTVNNTAFYISNEFTLLSGLKSIIGVRAENYVQRHTGRDQSYASGDLINGKNLDNDVVLDSLNFFPSVNFIYELTGNQNLRFSYSKTIARPSFKELSFAQIIDPLTNRIFNGSLFTYSDWDGQLTPTDINNYDLRWEYFMERGELLSVSAFYKEFTNPIELVRIPEQQTSTEYQPRNVGNGSLFGIELEMRKNLGFISSRLDNFGFSGNVTMLRSRIDMSDAEFSARKGYEKTGQTIEDTREMAGQSPYVINAGLTYSNFDDGLEAGLFYNVKGRTLTIVGGGLFPDIYDIPFHSLNFSLSKNFGVDKLFNMNFSVSNILNDRRETMYGSFQAEDQVFTSLNPGRTFGLSLSRRF